MKLVTSLAFALAATLSATVFAADKAPADKLTPQQQKLSDCAKDAHAKSLKGDEYKSYMSTCTKGNGTATTGAPAAATKATPASATAAGDTASTSASSEKTKADRKAAAKSGEQKWVPAPSGSNAQQEKMKSCATDAKAKGLKGAERRTFMSTCLKGDGSAPATTTTPAKTTK